MLSSAAGTGVHQPAYLAVWVYIVEFKFQCGHSASSRGAASWSAAGANATYSAVGSIEPMSPRSASVDTTPNVKKRRRVYTRPLAHYCSRRLRGRTRSTRPCRYVVSAVTPEPDKISPACTIIMHGGAGSLTTAQAHSLHHFSRLTTRPIGEFCPRKKKQRPSMGLRCCPRMTKLGWRSSPAERLGQQSSIGDDAATERLGPVPRPITNRRGVVNIAHAGSKF